LRAKRYEKTNPITPITIISAKKIPTINATLPIAENKLVSKR